MNQWYVITGGPSTGKTTLLSALSKFGHTVPEAARTVIDRARENGISMEELRSDEQAFQEKVVMLKDEFERTTDCDRLTFFDRGMQDTLAYMGYYGYSIADWINELCKKSHYNAVFLLDPLEQYEKDYARIEDDAFRIEIQRLLRAAYEGSGMSVVSVPALTVEERRDYIMDYIKGDRRS